MDPRRAALRETLDLLKSEGWAPDESTPDQTGQVVGDELKSGWRPSLWMFVCFISLAINVVLVASQHDQGGPRGGTPASLTLLSLEEPKFSKTAGWALSVDGTTVWRRRADPYSPLALAKDVASIEFDSRCVVQLWRDSPKLDDAPSLELIGQAFVAADIAGDSPVGIDLMLDGVVTGHLVAKVTKLNGYPPR